MYIKNVVYPTELEKVNKYNDSIDVFVETIDGYNYTLTICTPQFYYRYMEKEGLNFIPASPPDIIVKKLTNDYIIQALHSFCEDDGYWMKAFALLGRKAGVCSNIDMDKILNCL